MLSKASLLILGWTYRWGAFIKINPYDWDSESRVISITRSKWRYRAWELTVLSMYAHTCFTAFRQLQSAFMPDVSVAQFIFQLFFLLCSHLGTLFSMPVFFLPAETADFINQLMLIEVRTEFQDTRPRIDTAAVMMILFLFQAPTQLLGILFLCFQNPNQSKTWIWSLFGGNTSRLVLLLEPIIHQYEWNFIFFFAFTSFAFLCFSDDAIRRLRYNSGKLKLRESDSNPAMKTFRSIQILVSSYNKTFGLLALPQQNFNSMVMATSCLYASVRFYNSISIFAYLLFPTSLTAITIFCAVIFTLSARLTLTSRVFLRSWRSVESRELGRELSSFKELIIRIGPFHKIERNTSMTYLAAVVGYSINLLLSF